MAIQTLYDKDGSLAPLTSGGGKTIAVLGYGSQGHAHAQNLRDSGLNVIVANRADSPNGKLAAKHGFSPMPVADAVKQADVIVITLPDEVQPDVYQQHIGPNLTAGKTLLFTHGFNIHFKTITPPEDVNVIMVAPKGPGHTVRWEYERGGGVPCLMAIHQDASAPGSEHKAKDLALAYAIGVGGGKGGTLVTTFEQECVTDLFGEQVVLCGGLSESIKRGFEVLTEAGYPPELAYFEVCHELELIINLIKRGGLDYMRYSISNTAEFGDYYTGPKICNDDTKQRMADALKHIQDGSFAKAFRDDYKNGFKWFKAQRAENAGHAVESVGKELRQMMPWLKPVEMHNGEAKEV